MAMKKNSGLGKGLNALIPEISQEETQQREIRTLKISQIQPNPDQPRKTFDAEKLQLLANSIEEHGIIQPIVVRKEDSGFYTIIAGERRWRAARLAHLSEVPVVVKTFDDLAVAEVALIENLQREDLNPVEEARGYQRLIEEFNLTQDEVSKKIGKSRPAITNSMRLLTLCPAVLKLLEQLEISSGHARALLGIEDDAEQEKLAFEIIEKDLSVRQVERFVKDKQSGKENPPDEKQPLNVAKDELENQLSAVLGTKVKITQKKNKKGKIEIEFYDNDSLNKIVGLLKKG